MRVCLHMNQKGMYDVYYELEGFFLVAIEWVLENLHLFICGIIIIPSEVLGYS